MKTSQWLYFHKAIDPKWCDDYVKWCEKSYQKVDSAIGFESAKPDKDYRESDIRWLTPNREQGLIDILMGHVHTANRNHFGINIQTPYINELQFTTYNSPSGKYGWHHDVDLSTPLAVHRKLSITLQLSDSKDYEGGEFQFHTADQMNDKQKKEVRDKGTILVFPSFLEHQVTAVTKGTRHVVVAWIEGPHWT
jgi:PKHD-type hydroxylase